LSSSLSPEAAGVGVSYTLPSAANTTNTGVIGSPAAVPITVPERVRRTFVQLPSDALRSSELGYELGCRYVQGPDLLVGPLDGPFQSAFLGALCAVLHRYSQQDSIPIDLHFFDSVTGKRTLFSLAAPIGAEESISLAIARAAESLRHALAGGASAETHASTNVAITYAYPSLAGSGVRSGPGSFDVEAYLAALPVRYDLHFLLTGEERPAPLVVTYNAKLFRAATIERIIKSLLLLFPAAIAQPDVAIGRLPVLDAADTHRLTVEWASGKAHYAEEPVHLLFEALARERPTALAATFQQEQITYGELDRQARGIAASLQAHGLQGIRLLPTY